MTMVPVTDLALRVNKLLYLSSKFRKKAMGAVVGTDRGGRIVILGLAHRDLDPFPRHITICRATTGAVIGSGVISNSLGLFGCVAVLNKGCDVPEVGDFVWDDSLKPTQPSTSASIVFGVACSMASRFVIVNDFYDWGGKAWLDGIYLTDVINLFAQRVGAVCLGVTRELVYDRSLSYLEGMVGHIQEIRKYLGPDHDQIVQTKGGFHVPSILPGYALIDPKGDNQVAKVLAVVSTIGVVGLDNPSLNDPVIAYDVSGHEIGSGYVFRVPGPDVSSNSAIANRCDVVITLGVENIKPLSKVDARGYRFLLADRIDLTTNNILDYLNEQI